MTSNKLAKRTRIEYQELSRYFSIHRNTLYSWRQEYETDTRELDIENPYSIIDFIKWVFETKGR